jgi:nucleotide-binding universal stress UspA family protein
LEPNSKTDIARTNRIKLTFRGAGFTDALSTGMATKWMKVSVNPICSAISIATRGYRYAVPDQAGLPDYYRHQLSPRRLIAIVAGDQFGVIARRFDLAVVGQAEPETNAVEENIVEAALFDSGGVIIVPYIQKAPLKLDHIMLCWDGSRAAARAIRDATPFLRRAGRIEVVIVANERGKQDQIEHADIGAHLARRGLNVAVKRMPLGDVDVTDMQLSHAADEGVDFIVMGGYGHSRLREFVLGGVTRSMLRTMTVPVLMSH